MHPLLEASGDNWLRAALGGFDLICLQLLEVGVKIDIVDKQGFVILLRGVNCL